MLIVGDDWAEDHHDIELMDAAGRRLARARLPEGVDGIARLHAMIGAQLGPDAETTEVVVGIETDRGVWVAALVAAGYRVLAVNPLQVARYRERYRVSGAKSDAGDAHTLADMVRTDGHQLRGVAADSELAEAVKVLARTHKTLIWEQTRHTLRLRHALREYFPAALDAFADLDAPEALEVLDRAPTPELAAELTLGQLRKALVRARRRGDLTARAAAIQTALQAAHLAQPAVITVAYAATTRATVAVLQAVQAQIASLQRDVKTHFGRHPDVDIIRSQPGIGVVVGARVLAEFGDAPGRYHSAKARKNYAATSPVTRASGKRRVVTARWVQNDRLTDALITQAGAAIRVSPGARAYYLQQRDRGAHHNAALRQLANRLVGILHGCLKTRTCYDETTAWAHHTPPAQQAAA